MDAQNHTLQLKVNEVQNHNYGIRQLTCRISPYQKNAISEQNHSISLNAIDAQNHI